MALMAGYFRTSDGNITVSENIAVTPADFDKFRHCRLIRASAVDASGAQLCGIYDLKPSGFGPSMSVQVTMSPTRRAGPVGINAPQSVTRPC